jgi:beta-glucoside operon transcriptional antiterminator
VQAIKRINHNTAVCLDGAGHELIATGKGIGFGDMPHDVPLDQIQRTFYGIDPKYLAFIEEVDPEVLEFAAQLASLATQQLSYELSPNLPITLADHIQFALKRARDHMVVAMPLWREAESAYPVEYRLGEMAVAGLQKTFGVRIQRQEAAGIALSIVNAAVSSSPRAARAERKEEQLFTRIARIIEQRMDTPIDETSFAYTRFESHIRYLLERLESGQPFKTENAELYTSLSSQYPEAASCAREVADAIGEAYGTELSDEEVLYLILHITRVVAKSE